MPPRKRTITAKRVTEEVTLTETTHDDSAPSPVPWAPGWAAIRDVDDPAYATQRQDQMLQCLDLLRLQAMSTTGTDLPEGLRRETVTVLRAGPDASPMERTLGRS